MESHYIQLKEDIIKRLSYEPLDLEEVIRCFRLEKFEANETLFNQSLVAKKVYFVCEGVIEISFLDDNLKKRTAQLSAKGEWIAALNSFHSQMPSDQEIKALTKSEVLSLGYNNFERFYSNLPAFKEVFQEILKELYFSNEQRLKLLVSKDAKSRIKWLYQHKKDLTSLLKDKDLADYLHLNKDVFSRLKHQALLELRS